MPTAAPVAAAATPPPLDANALASTALEAALADQPIPDIPDPVTPPAATDTPPADTPPADPLDAAIQGDPPPAAAKPDEPVPPVVPPGTDPATIPGTPEHKAAADAAAAAAKPAEPTDEEKAATDRKAALDKELDADGVRNVKTRERIHNLTNTLAAQAPMVTTLEKAGIKDVKALEATIGNAQAAVDIIGMVKATGATPDNYTLALDYLAINTKADGGDTKAADQAIAWLAEELTRHCLAHGREPPTLGDPLTAHADLVKDVADEKITRERALEIAAGRADQARRSTQSQADEQQRTAEKTRTEAIEAGRTDLRTVSVELFGATPETKALYKRLEPQLVAAIPDITKNFAPAQWGGALRLLFRNLASLAPAAAAPTPTPKPAAKPTGNIGPSRSTGVTPHLTPEFTDPAKALEAGIAAADAGY